MVSFKLKFLLILVNVLGISLLYNYIPASTLVFIAMIPALFYGIMTRRFFLILFVILVLIVVVGLFVIMFTIGFEGEITEAIRFEIWLYLQLYPYQMESNLVNILGIPILLGITLFIFFVFLLGRFLMMNEFKIMIIFSYFIMIFTSFYLIVNIFLYLFPGLRVLILENIYFQGFLSFFYVILPMIVLTLSILFLELLFSREERKKYWKDVKTLKKATDRNIFKQLIKTLIFLLFIVLIIIAVIMGIING